MAGLKKNICQLDGCVSVREIEGLSTQRTIYVGDALEYACQFWASHIVESTCSGPGVGEVHKAIDEFFSNCFLSWIEVLSLMEKLDIGAYALEDIQKWYTKVSRM